MKHNSQATFLWEMLGRNLFLFLCLYNGALLCSLGRKYLHFDYDNNTKYYENKS